MYESLLELDFTYEEKKMQIGFETQKAFRSRKNQPAIQKYNSCYGTGSNIDWTRTNDNGARPQQSSLLRRMNTKPI